jgi:hypothetical protein
MATPRTAALLSTSGTAATASSAALAPRVPTSVGPIDAFATPSTSASAKLRQHQSKAARAA